MTVNRISILVPLLVALAAEPAGRAAAESKPVSPDIAVRLSDGRTVTLTPFRTDEKQGLSDAQCGLTIEGRQITIIGTDETGAYTCRGLVEVGPLPPAAQKERIGLIFDVASPNATFRTAVLLIRDAEGWSLDKTSIGRYDDRPEAQSLTALADALRNGW